MLLDGEIFRRRVTTSFPPYQIHHRGQMTVLMRQTGLKVSDVNGPSREEVADIGMKTPCL